MSSAGRILHEDLIVFDGLVIPISDRDGLESLHPTENDRHILDMMRRGGLTAANCTCSVWEGFSETMQRIALWKRLFLENTETIVQCRTTEEIRQAKRENKLGIVLGWQNTSGIEDKIPFLSLFHDVGVRIIQLTYNTQNLVGSGCYESRDGGLSDFGREVISELNRLRIVIDLSHVGTNTAADAIEISAQAPCYSHVAPRKFKNHPRNKSDEALKAIADRGGFIGTCMFPPFMPRGEDTTLDEYLETIEHVIDVAGEEAVGFGTDFNIGNPERSVYWTHDKGYARKLTNHGTLRYPEGLRSYADYPNLTRAMQGRKWSERRIRGVMGENWMRYLHQIWGR